MRVPTTDQGEEGGNVTGCASSHGLCPLLGSAKKPIEGQRSLEARYIGKASYYVDSFPFLFSLQSEFTDCLLVEQTFRSDPLHLASLILL